MKDFPDFMKRPANRIATASQSTKAVAGHVFDGSGDNQMAFWTCHQTASSTPHTHEYDESMVVIQGCYTVIVDGRRIPLTEGEECFFPRGLLPGGEVAAATRTRQAFGGHRADRSPGQ